MVVGALIAGVLVGILVPSPKSPSATSSVVAPPFVSQEKAEAKAKRELVAYAKEKDNAVAAEEKENATKETAKVPSPPLGEAKTAEQDTKPCSQQTWPYYSASCIDRSAPAPSSYKVTNARRADPAIALHNEKNQTATPAPSREARQTPKAPAPVQTSAEPAPAQPSTSASPGREAHPTPKTSAPVQVAAPQPSTPTQTAPSAQGQTPPRASTSSNSRAPGNTQSSSVDNEDQIEKPRQRQQRGQPRYTRIDPPDDGHDSPPILLRRDGTRVYILPEDRGPRGYWRSW
jgi:hypothetical protein